MSRLLIRAYCKICANKPRGLNFSNHFIRGDKINILRELKYLRRGSVSKLSTRRLNRQQDFERTNDNVGALKRNSMTTFIPQNTLTSNATTINYIKKCIKNATALHKTQ